MSSFIETPRLLIRPFERTDGDVAAMHLLFSDPEVVKYIGGVLSDTVEKTQERVWRWIHYQETLGYSSWAVMEKSSGEIIGDCGLFPFENLGPEVELGYDFRRDCWGKGYATESARACLDYGFREFQFDRIVAVALPENIASRRVLEKCGMKENGMRHCYNLDLIFYEITNTKVQDSCWGNLS
jgi:RimJ/RimL family protein N-acetyltransferase